MVRWPFSWVADIVSQPELSLPVTTMCCVAENLVSANPGRARLVPGFNDMATTRPDLAAELVGTNPAGVIAGTHEILLWRCPNHDEPYPARTMASPTRQWELKSMWPRVRLLLEHEGARRVQRYGYYAPGLGARSCWHRPCDRYREFHKGADVEVFDPQQDIPDDRAQTRRWLWLSVLCQRAGTAGFQRYGLYPSRHGGLSRGHRPDNRHRRHAQSLVVEVPQPPRTVPRTGGRKEHADKCPGMAAAIAAAFESCRVTTTWRLPGLTWRRNWSAPTRPRSSLALKRCPFTGNARPGIRLWRAPRAGRPFHRRIGLTATAERAAASDVGSGIPSGGVLPHHGVIPAGHEGSTGVL